VLNGSWCSLEVRILFAGQYPRFKQRKIGLSPELESQACGAERCNNGRFEKVRVKLMDELLICVW
jgi:hypothetical protein